MRTKQIKLCYSARRLGALRSAPTTPFANIGENGDQKLDLAWTDPYQQ